MAVAASKKIVLVVDDNEAMRENLCECLVDEGYVCWTEASAADALRRLEAEPHPPDLVLIDLRMPGMTVEEFVSHMRERVAWATVSIILSTGAEREEIPSDLAIDGVLLKPFDPARLFELVRGTIEGRTGCDAHAP